MQANQQVKKKPYVRTTVQVIPLNGSQANLPINPFPEPNYLPPQQPNVPEPQPDRRPGYFDRRKKRNRPLPVPIPTPLPQRRRQIEPEPIERRPVQTIRDKSPLLFNSGYEDGYYYNDYVMRYYSIPYVLLHTVLFFVVNLAIIALQILLTIRQAYYYDIYTGFWGGGFNVFVAVLTLFSLCVRHYGYLIFLAVMHFIAFLVSVAIVILNIFSINFYNNCGSSTDSRCDKIESRPVNYTQLGLAIASIVLSVLFLAFLLALLNGFWKRKYIEQDLATLYPDDGLRPYLLNNWQYQDYNYYDDYIETYFSKIIGLFHSLLFLIVNLACIGLQIVLQMRLAYFYYVYAGFWAGGFNAVVALLTLITLCLRNFGVLVFLVLLHIVGFLASIALIILNTFPVNLYNNCGDSIDGDCSKRESKDINYALIALGAVSTILAVLFIAYVLALLNGLWKKRFVEKHLPRIMPELLSQNDFNQLDNQYDQNEQYSTYY